MPRENQSLRHGLRRATSLYTREALQCVGKRYAINIEAEKIYFYCRRKPRFKRDTENS